MNGDKSPAEIIRLPSTRDEQDAHINAMLEQFKEVQQSSDLDTKTKDLGMPASLLNFYFATKVDLSSIGLEAAVYIPVQISEREAGRKSLYYLDQNEEVLVGIYVTGEGIALRLVKRVTGTGLPAQIGDVYSTKITNREGKSVFEGQAVLEQFDSTTGKGHFNVTQGQGQWPTFQETVQSALPENRPAHDVSSFSLFWSQIIYQPDFWSGS